ncbi:MAG: YncE family protein [Bacteroidota bacterium]
MRNKFIICAFILGNSLCFAQAQTSSNYKIVNKIHLDGDQKWDLLFSDDQAGRLYVSHGDRVQVVDEAKGELVGQVLGLKGVHGIAVAPEFNKGFISTKNDNMVTIFDTRTFETLKTVAVGKSPDAILYDAFSKKVFVFNGHSNNANVIDPSNNNMVATVDFTGNPELSVTDGKGKIYVNLESASAIAVINSTTYKVEHVWPIAPGEEPTGLALDNETQRLFTVCANKLMMVLNAENGAVITKLPIGGKADGAAFDPVLKRAYSSNGEGTLTIVQESTGDKFSVIETLPTQTGAKTIAINQLTHHVYLPTANSEPVQAGEKSKLAPGSFIVLDIMAQ